MAVRHRGEEPRLLSRKRSGKYRAGESQANICQLLQDRRDLHDETIRAEGWEWEVSFYKGLLATQRWGQVKLSLKLQEKVPYFWRWLEIIQQRRKFCIGALLLQTSVKRLKVTNSRLPDSGEESDLNKAFLQPFTDNTNGPFWRWKLLLHLDLCRWIGHSEPSNPQQVQHSVRCRIYRPKQFGTLWQSVPSLL